MKVLDINKKDLKNNINIIKNIVIGKEKDDCGNKIEIIAVVKANAMGLGLLEFSKFLIKNGITFLAVSTVEEAVRLRQAKIDTKILMLSPVYSKKDIETLLDNNIIMTIGSLQGLDILENILENRDEDAQVHLKIDTGLGRYGFLYDSPEIIEVFEKIKRIKIIGSFTHFSKPIDKKWTSQQFNRFLDAVARIKSSGYNPGILHCSSTTAALKYPEMKLNAVRIGSAFQGRTLVKELALKRIGTLKTNIEEIKIVPKGYNISYSNSYKTKRETQIAIIPVGYKDGLFMKKSRDSFSFKDNIISTLIEFKKIFKDNSIKVEINNKEYKIIGRVGMYHSIVDITGADIKVGDEVLINLPPLYISDNIKREYN